MPPQEPFTAYYPQQGLWILYDLIPVGVPGAIRHLLYAAACYPGRGRGVFNWGPGPSLPAPGPVQLGLQASRYDAIVDTEHLLVAVFSWQGYRSVAHTTLQADPWQLASYVAHPPVGARSASSILPLPQAVTAYPWHVLKAPGRYFPPRPAVAVWAPTGIERRRWRAKWYEYYEKSTLADGAGHAGGSEEQHQNNSFNDTSVAKRPGLWNPFNRQSANT